MTEMDFDELDKAVNSLMADVDTTKRNPGLDDPEDTVLSIEPSTPFPPKTESNQEVIPETKPVATTPFAPTSPPLAVKRRGQFMDVIHPSSDMTTAPTPVKHDGVNVQPAAPFAVRRPDEDVVDAPKTGHKEVDFEHFLEHEENSPRLTAGASNESTAEHEEKVDAEDKETAWNPGDAASDKNVSQTSDDEGAHNNEDPSSSDVANSQSDEVPSEVIEEVARTAEEAPQTSPFLADAKVEKRPLGGSGSASAVEASSPSELISAPVNEQIPVTNQVILPDELRDDVMSLESSSTPVTVVKQPTPSPVVTAVTTVATSLSAPEETTTSGSGSIQQQYAEQPSTGNDSHTSIYDTSTHHQPLGQAASKSSPMKWVILALVLLIVGAIAGALYFYFTTKG